MEPAEEVVSVAEGTWRQVESESAMRQLIARQIPSYTAMELPMSKRSGDLLIAPTVFFPDLLSVVMHFLDILSESNRLTWHGDLIPESQMWLKLGGDHGGVQAKHLDRQHEQPKCHTQYNPCVAWILG